MRIPIELLIFCGACVIIAVAGTFAIRRDFAALDRKSMMWEIFESFVAQLLMVLMLGAAALQVLVRYVISEDADLQWTEEFGRLVLVWAAFLGAASLQRQDDHIRMTLLYDFVPKTAQWIFRIFGDLIILAVLLPVTYLGWLTARNLDIMNTIALGVPLSSFAYPVPIAGALMIVHTVVLLLAHLLGEERSSVETHGEVHSE